MEETILYMRDLERHLNSVEHMLYVSCKFTKTVEMIRNVIENIVKGYEQFFSIAYQNFVVNNSDVDYDELKSNGIHNKIHLLSENLKDKGIYVDLSDYFMLKRILFSDYDKVGEFRKNLCMVSYLDDEEKKIDIDKLFDFYETLKCVCNSVCKCDRKQRELSEEDVEEVVNSSVN